jgi:MtN3 and saliva related transmembrane protein
MLLAEIIGAISAVLTTTAFLPQVIKVFKTRKTQDLAYGMLLMQGSGNFMWIIYGLMIKSWSLTIANILTFLLVLMIIIAKIKHR